MERVLKELESWIGYLEKKSNSQLEDKTANAGSNNYTIFGKQYEEYMSVKGFINAAWCAMFVSICFVKTYGLTMAKKLLCGNLWAYCPYMLDAFKKKGQLYTKPKKGDIILFLKNGVAYHTGYVWKVAGNYVYTIEGNTSGASGVIANGGGVCKKAYAITNNMRFARPKYSLCVATTQNAETEAKTETTTKTTKTTKKSVIKALQKAVGVSVDGIVGAETKAALPTLKNGSKGDVVKLLQKLLGEIYDIEVSGGYDGDFGSGTEKAVKAFQKKKGLTVDGIVGKKTWSKLLD